MEMEVWDSEGVCAWWAEAQLFGAQGSDLRMQAVKTLCAACGSCSEGAAVYLLLGMVASGLVDSPWLRDCMLPIESSAKAHCD